MTQLNNNNLDIRRQWTNIIIPEVGFSFLDGRCIVDEKFLKRF
jgi:hypothetical protein